MELRLRNKESIRINSDHENNNFIDVSGTEFDVATTIDLYPSFHYIEMRKKNGLVRLFLFKKKGYKKDFDFGYYTDAEVVFALNEVIIK